MRKKIRLDGIANTRIPCYMNADTMAVIKDNLDVAAGKGVTLTGNNEVGFGVTAGSPLHGIIELVEKDGTATIIVGGYVVGAPMIKFGTSPAYPAIGEFGLGVSENGEIVKLTAGKSGILWEIEDTSIDATTCTIKL